MNYLLASGVSVDDIGKLITQISTGVVLIAGTYITFVKTKHQTDVDDYTNLKKENKRLRRDNVTLVNYLYQVQLVASQHGINLPPPPHLLSQDDILGDEEDEKQEGGKK